MKNFKAYLLQKNNEKVTGQVQEISFDMLPVADCLIEVHYSAVNYKDYLACQTNGGVVRTYPFVPGIDLAGIIIQSANENFPVGQKVLATSFGLGVSHFGGWSEYASVPSEWLIKIPDEISLKQAVTLGTAGLTAALCVEAIKNHLRPDSRILITGATGGVSTMARILLKQLGFNNLVLMSQKKFETNDPVLSTADFLAQPKKALAKQEFDAVIDTVGGAVLSQLLSQVTYGGIVASCGNAGGIKLETTVLPFILRAVTLAGIDSVNTPNDLRQKAWAQLFSSFDFEKVSPEIISLAQIPEVVTDFAKNRHVGRTVIQVRSNS
ncbi:acrylyl-CoA reductase family protein [Enterococcus timonensis]|uniref:acrylyl-CoA reductase family protein n=1 Tax=Enterococcus timonensis TaxID=1852364 RepID=UPI0008DA9A9D|nr:acryloyl-CoA reductase [Enterococcus timonensis]